MENQTPTRPTTVVQFGQGQKIHLMEFYFIQSKETFFPMSCGVERRWNVHGTYEHDTLTIADVDCKKCLARIERLRENGRLE
tara:strand:+ start:374 stop:619 length:246 start_codon:yes stop_codon:yes gene_type:complete